MTENNTDGFTLVELLVVVALLAIIAAVGMPTYSGFVSESKKSKAKSELNLIALAQTNFKNTNGSYYSSSSTTCTSATNNNSSIETALFEGKKILSSNFNFCTNAAEATDTSVSSYTIYAFEANNNSKGFTLDSMNVMTSYGY